MNEKCFARQKNGACAAVTCNCPGYAACAFYKPIWRWKQDQEAHARMLRRLPEERQVCISEKYYRGRMPWREEAE